MPRGNHTTGPDRCGGRRAGDPNKLNEYTIGKNYKPPMPAARRKTNKGGKIHYSIDIPPYLFDKMREEAIERKISMARLGLEWLEAAAAYFEEDRR